MTNDEVVDLLSLITAYDNRNATSATVMAWGTASEIGRWTAAGAMEAVHQHFAESTEFLMPAHITQRLRLSRRADSASVRALPGPGPASEEHRACAMAAATELLSRHPEFRRTFAMPWTGHRRARNADGRAVAERELQRLREQM